MDAQSARSCQICPSRRPEPAGIPARRIAPAVVLALAFMLAMGALAMPAEAQCAMCRSAFDSPEGREMIRRYQAGIALLLAVPFAAFATVAILAVRGKRKLEFEDE